jgi:hypothetical protein
VHGAKIPAEKSNAGNKLQIGRKKVNVEYYTCFLKKLISYIK